MDLLRLRLSIISRLIFYFGNLSKDISRKNFVLADTIPAAKEGPIQKVG